LLQHNYYNNTNYNFPKQGILIALLSLLLLSCNDKAHLPKENKLTKEWGVVVESADSFVYNKHKDLAIKSIVEGFRKIDQPSVLDSCYYYKFWLWMYKDVEVDYDRALDYVDSIDVILKRNKAENSFPYLAAFVNYWRGDIFFATGDYKAAYDAYFTGKELAQKEFNPCELGNFYYRLAMVLYKQERFDESAFQFQRCLELSKSCHSYFNYEYHIQEVIDNIGLCYYHQNKIDSAFHYFQKALHFINHEVPPHTPFQDTLYQVARGVIYGNMGSVYEELRKDSLAEYYYKQNIAINKASNREIKDAIKTQIKLARLYLRNNNNLKFWYAIDDCNHLLEEYYDPEAKENYLSIMAEHLLSRDSIMALQYFLKAKQLNDSLQQVEKNIKAIDLRAHVDELEKEHTIEELQKNNNQKVIFLTIAISVSILSVIVIFLVVFYLKRLRTFIKKHRQLNLQVTQQKIELEKAVHKLEIAYKEKDKILNIVAHDLRSPINSILALADILSQSATMNKELSEAIELIKTACQNSLGLSKEILESAILMQSKELNLAEISINELMANTVSLLRFRSAEKQINLELLLTKKDYCLRVDKDKIQRVFNNLITNAIKFSQHGSTISVAMEADDEGLIIKVKDFGIGIPEKIRPKIFDMFTEAKREGTDGEKAYGLGLSITKQIVEIHGGKIWVESEEGVGTIFFVFLPFNFIVPEL
jgi:signal transduction histidine kinase